MKKMSQLTDVQQELFDKNLTRVDQFVRKYRGRLDSDELESNAMLALFECSRLWEPSKGSFLTYLNRSFDNVVSDMLEEKTRQHGTMPYTEQKELKKRLEELENVMDTVKKDPSQFTTEEITNLEEQVDTIREFLHEKNVPKSVSLDVPLSGIEEGNIELSDIIEDMQAISLEDMVTYNYLRDQIRKSLTPRNYRIVELIEEGYTNQEIANLINGQFPDEPNITTGEGVSITLVEKVIPAVKEILEQEADLVKAVE